jgi:hypothetical protein
VLETKGSQKGSSDEDSQVHLEVGKRKGGEGEDKHAQGDSCQDSSPTIEYCFIVGGGWMFESKGENQKKWKEPGREKEEAEDTETAGGGEENKSASMTKNRIGNMTSIELSDGHQIQSRDEESNPPRECQRMQDEIRPHWDLTNDYPLKE